MPAVVTETLKGLKVFCSVLGAAKAYRACQGEFSEIDRLLWETIDEYLGPGWPTVLMKVTCWRIRKCPTTVQLNS